jgi:UDP-N-acetylglucosamine 1-carboxyvinyltransferase
MAEEAKKIGQLITKVRKERGLTQTDLAKKLGTSQSAVNRMENGGQNLSMEMLTRISEVLNKEIITIADPQSDSFEIHGGKELSGEITTKVSKNASVAILAATLLNKGTSTLKDVPKIEEVFRLIEVLESIGVSIKWKGHTLVVRPPAQLKLDKINNKAARQTRSIIMFLGPLIHQFNEFTLPFAGGCKLGTRTVRPHLYALEEFGVDIKASHNKYHVTVKPQQPDQIILYEMSETATENAIMAAAGSPGRTVIKYASHNYMVRDLCLYLMELGVRIDGFGTSTLTIHGRKNIKKNVTYHPSEDPIESMMFLSVAATTNSSFVIKRCPIDFLELELLKLKKMGFNYEILKTYKAKNGVRNLADIKTLKSDALYAPGDKIHALPYPGINMDNLPFFVPIAARAKGRTLIHDWSYENRAIYYTELAKLGVTLELVDAHRVYINGPNHFKPVEIVTPPALRPAVIVLIAMLAAPGRSVLRNVYSIKRGYEDLANRLNSLGADIKILRDI